MNFVQSFEGEVRFFKICRAHGSVMNLLKVTKLCCITWFLRLLNGLIYKGQLSKIMSYVYHVHHCVFRLILATWQELYQCLRCILYQCVVNALSMLCQRSVILCIWVALVSLGLQCNMSVYEMEQVSMFHAFRRRQFRCYTSEIN